MRRFAAFGALVVVAVGWTAATGTLRVNLDDRMKARPIEGYVWFAGLDRARRVTTASATLHGSGRHMLVSYIRTCDGNCSLLDPPSKRCSRALTLRAGPPRRVTVRLLDSGCRIILR